MTEEILEAYVRIQFKDVKARKLFIKAVENYAAKFGDRFIGGAYGTTLDEIVSLKIPEDDDESS